MSRHSKRSVFIVNPVSECRHTTRRSARRYVEQGRARWLDGRQDVIEFVAGDRRHQAAAAAPAPIARAHSPRVDVVQEQLACGRYRNEFLGLPNFVGFLPDKGTRSRRIAA